MLVSKHEATQSSHWIHRALSITKDFHALVHARYIKASHVDLAKMRHASCIAMECRSSDVTDRNNDNLRGMLFPHQCMCNLSLSHQQTNSVLCICI